MADQVSEVKSKVDIVEVVREHVELKKAGRNYKGLCPFHSEKTPSFMVSPELQIFKCFGCGESGDVISFLMKHEGMEFYEALKMLAEKVGVKLRRRVGIERSERERVIEMNELAARLYHYLILKHEMGRAFLKYVKNERGIKMETVRKFKLGAAPNKQSLLFDYLTKKRGFEADELERAGLVLRVRGGWVDRFRGRVIFPITNNRGQVIGLAGRILPRHESARVGKYINSPETAAFHKSDVLFGLSVNKHEIRKEGEAVIVEGPLDVISSWQAGVMNAVAIQGTSLTEQQARVLSRFTDRVVLALDSDFAGDSAAMRGITLAQNMGLEIKVCQLKEYKDPDEYARADPKGYKETLAGAIGVWDFVIEVIFSRHGGSAMTRVSREVVPVLAGISDKIVQAHYIKIVAERMGVPVEAVAREIESAKEMKQKRKEVYFGKEIEKKGVREAFEERLLGLALMVDPLLLLGEYKELVQAPLGKRILVELEKYMGNIEQFEVAGFLAELPAELKDGFVGVLLQEEVEGELARREFLMVVKRLALYDISEEMGKLAGEITRLEKAGKKRGLGRTRKRFAELSGQRAELED